MKLYHEKQEASLCGVHAVNSLLQGPFLTEVDLADIAAEVDEEERKLMAEGGVDEESYLRFMAEESSNVREDGMFSVQVLARALARFGLECIPLRSPRVRDTAGKAPEDEQAFICNLSEHWFTVRKVSDGSWWDFNSLKPAPAPVTAFYLSAFLSSLEEQGYTIFVIRGDLPAPGGPPGAEAARTRGTWLTPDEAKSLSKEAEGARHRSRVAAVMHNVLARAGQGQKLSTGSGAGKPPAFADDADDDLAAAIAASVADVGGAGTVGGGSDDDLARAIAESLKEHAPSQQQPQQPPVAKTATRELLENAGLPPDDSELAKAIAMSLEAHAAAPAAAVEAGVRHHSPPDRGAAPAAPRRSDGPQLHVVVRLPSGSREQIELGRSAGLAELCAALSRLGVDAERHRVSKSFPRQVLSGSGALVDMGVQDREVLIVERR
ncbi:unnamed protein product [Pedinophyceae sp. YPF-701]|nr:unnamed protein product [Pedinophyceae sp. YPF-701]